MQNYAQQEHRLRSGGKLSLPALSDSGSLLRKPPLQRNQVLKLQDELVYTLSDDFSKIPSAVRSTMTHLTSRHMEVSQWQAQVFLSISQVDQEMTSLEQVKDMVEGCLQEKQVYSQLLSDCVMIGSTLSPAGLRQDRVMTELKKEEQLIKESREALQNHIITLLRNLSFLKEIRAQLQDDFQDKGEAIKLITRCITCEVDTPCSHLPAAQCKLNHVSHDKWLSHSKNLKVNAEKLIVGSLSIRRNLQFILTNIKNTQEHQRLSTEKSLQRKIHKLKRIKEMLTWEKQRVNEEISDLTKDVQKLEGQIRNCESRLHQTNHRLDILNQRSRYELCLDHSHISLKREKQDLEKLATGLFFALKRSHQNMELALSRLAGLEDKLVRNAHSLEVALSCQRIHQSILPALDRAVILANRSRLHPLVGSSSTQTHLH